MTLRDAIARLLYGVGPGAPEAIDTLATLLEELTSQIRVQGLTIDVHNQRIGSGEAFERVVRGSPMALHLGLKTDSLRDEPLAVNPQERPELGSKLVEATHLKPAEVEKANVKAIKSEDVTAGRDPHFSGMVYCVFCHQARPIANEPRGRRYVFELEKTNRDLRGGVEAYRKNETGLLAELDELNWAATREKQRADAAAARCEAMASACRELRAELLSQPEHEPLSTRIQRASFVARIQNILDAAQSASGRGDVDSRT